MVHSSPQSFRPLAAAVTAVTATILTLDLTWLGFVARSLYDSALGSLRREEIYWPAAILFYALYVLAILRYAVLDADSTKRAFTRGAAIGFLSYGTYDLTNWAVLKGWPSIIVPIDIAWGILLTAIAAFVGKAAALRAGRHA